MDAVNDYVLYTRGPIEGEPPALGPNFQWRQITKPSSDALWMLSAFPAALKADKIDVVTRSTTSAARCSLPGRYHRA